MGKVAPGSIELLQTSADKKEGQSSLAQKVRLRNKGNIKGPCSIHAKLSLCAPRVCACETSQADSQATNMGRVAHGEQANLENRARWACHVKLGESLRNLNVS